MTQHSNSARDGRSARAASSKRMPATARTTKSNRLCAEALDKRCCWRIPSTHSTRPQRGERRGLQLAACPRHSCCLNSRDSRRDGTHSTRPDRTPSTMGDRSCLDKQGRTTSPLVAQLDRAGGFYPQGCGFDSCQAGQSMPASTVALRGGESTRASCWLAPISMLVNAQADGQLSKTKAHARVGLDNAPFASRRSAPVTSTFSAPRASLSADTANFEVTNAHIDFDRIGACRGAAGTALYAQQLPGTCLQGTLPLAKVDRDGVAIRGATCPAKNPLILSTMGDRSYLDSTGRTQQISGIRPAIADLYGSPITRGRNGQDPGLFPECAGAESEGVQIQRAASGFLPYSPLADGSSLPMAFALSISQAAWAPRASSRGIF